MQFIGVLPGQSRGAECKRAIIAFGTIHHGSLRSRIVNRAAIEQLFKDSQIRKSTQGVRELYKPPDWIGEFVIQRFNAKAIRLLDYQPVGFFERLCKGYLLRLPPAGFFNQLLDGRDIRLRKVNKRPSTQAGVFAGSGVHLGSSHKGIQQGNVPVKNTQAGRGRRYQVCPCMPALHQRFDDNVLFQNNQSVIH